MSILLVGDLHFKLDNMFQCSQLHAQIENILDTKNVSKNVEHVIILGDVLHYHEKIHSSILNRVTEFVKMIASHVPLTILVGNHDMINNQVFCDSTGHWMTVFKGWKNITVVDVPQYIYACGLKIAAIPYVYVGRFAEALEKFEINLDKASICVAHQEFRGCKMGAIESTSGDEYVSKTPCYSGHIHNTQTVGSVLYTGSAFEHSFGSPKCYLWILDPTSLSCDKIPSEVVSKNTTYVKLARGETELDIRVPENAVPHLHKCVITVDRPEDYLAWLNTTQGIMLSKKMTIGCNISQDTKEMSNESPNELTRDKDTDVLTMYRDIITTRHPDCLETMNMILGQV